MNLTLGSFPIQFLGTLKVLLMIICHSSSLEETRGNDREYLLNLLDHSRV